MYSNPSEYENDKEFVDTLMVKFRRYTEMLTPNFERALTHWKRYISKEPVQDDHRDPKTEQWRSRLAVPKATANTNAVAATVANIITSSSPIIQAVKTSDLDTDEAAYGERLVNYVLRGNKFRSRVLPVAVRYAEIQGMQPLKMMWQDRSRNVFRAPGIEEYEHFWNAVISKAKELGIDYPDPREDPEAFNVWVENLRGAGHNLPEMPAPNFTSPGAYKGPWISMPSFFSIVYNPLIADEQEQEIVMERTIVPVSYVEALADDDPDSELPYWKNALLYAKEHNVSERYNLWETEFHSLRGINSSVLTASDEPFIEIIETYMPAHPDIQFAAIANRCVVLNKRTESPLPTGDIPYVFLQRVRGNDSVGFTPYESNGGLLDEVNALESSKLDAVNITAIPFFTILGAKQGEVLTMNDIKPGSFKPVSSHTDIKQVEVRVPGEVFKEAYELEATIDMGWGVGSNVRGQQATINRVSLGEHQSRLTQATLPLIEFARDIEDKLNTMIPWIFALFQKYADEDTKFKLKHKLETVDPNKVAAVLEMDFQFTGATQAGNRGELAQIIFMWMKSVANVLQPEELREIAKVTAGLLGIPDMQSIINTQGMPMLPPPPSSTPQGNLEMQTEQPPVSEGE